MPTATVTVRTVKNKTTGIDLTVPTYREVPGRLSSTYFYHVVVVTNLSVFKSPKHKETDTVQFMVEKKFVDFEELRDRLNEKFSGTLFPTLPKRVLRENEAVARLRRGELEHFVKFLATVPKMVTSPVVLEFLGVGSIKAGTFRHGSVEDGGKQKKDSAKEEDESETKDADETPNEPETTLFEDDKDDVDELFLEENSEETEDTTQIFDEQDFGGGISKDDDDSALFLPDAVVEKKTVITVVEETDPSLYQFDNDDLEQILKTEVKKKSKESENKKVSETAQKPLDKPKPPLKPKPGAKPDLKPKPGSKPDLKPKPSEPKPEENFSSDDILQYISQNSTADDDDDDVDLFS